MTQGLFRHVTQFIVQGGELWKAIEAERHRPIKSSPDVTTNKQQAEYDFYLAGTRFFEMAEVLLVISVVLTALTGMAALFRNAIF